MASLFTSGKFQAINSAGVVPGALLYTYLAGTTTLLATYTNQGGASTNANPVVCDSAGQADVWLGTSAYHLVLKTAAGVTVWDEDNVAASASGTDIADTATATLGDALVGVKRVAMASPQATTVHSWIERQQVHLKDFAGAVCDGTSDDASAFLLTTAYFVSLANPGGTLLFPAKSRFNTNGGMTITATHGLRWLGDNMAYTVGAENGSSRIDFYGTGSFLTLSGILSAQSAFRFENLRLENKGAPTTGNGIVAVNSAFTAGLQVIGSQITGFSSGINCNTAQPNGYVYLKNSAFYNNATWGVAVMGNIVDIDGCVIGNNGPAWGALPNTFNAAPVGGGVLIENVSTAVAIRGGCDVEGVGVGIFVRNSYGVTIEGNYFESVAKCAVQATAVVGLRIEGNYMSSATEAATLLITNCANVQVKANGYSPKVYALGLTDYDLDGCNVVFIDTNLNRAVQDTMYCMKSVYGRNVDFVDADANYLAAPTPLTNMTGPVLQAEIGPFGAPVNRYTTTAAGGYFAGASVAATVGQYVYFSVLIRNATAMQAIVRDTADLNPIVIQTLTQYNKEWSVLTVGGVVAVAASYRLTLVISTNGEVFDLGGYVGYVRATPIKRQIFSFANGRRSPNRRATITYSASMTPDMSLGDIQEITATNATAFTINAPLFPADGQKLTVRIRNTSGGALGVVTWNAVFKMAAWTSPATANSRSTVFEYNGTNWVQVAQSAADVPN